MNDQRFCCYLFICIVTKAWDSVDRQRKKNETEREMILIYGQTVNKIPNIKIVHSERE